MLQRLPIIAILFTFAVLAQVAPTQPTRVLRGIINKTSDLSDVEKGELIKDVQQHPDQCLLFSTALLKQKDESRILVAIATSTDKSQKEAVRKLMEDLIATKVNALLCATVLEQLGLSSARYPRYDRVMGMMLAYSPPADFTNKRIKETTMDDFHVVIVKLNDRDILQQFHGQGPDADPTAIATNRNRLRNAIVKQITREMLGFLQQAKNSQAALKEARRCIKELDKIQKTQQEQFPNDVDDNFPGWSAKPLKDAAAYCLLLASESPNVGEEALNEAFFAMTDSIAELPPPWIAIVKEYAVKYHRKQDYDFLRKQDYDFQAPNSN